MMEPHLFESSRGEILRLLRRAPRSVNDLAKMLGVTDNAVRSILARLERNQLVRKSVKRPGFRKPESMYDITPDAERLFARAYAPVLQTLLAVLEAHSGEKDLMIQLREVGRRLAAPYLPLMKGLSLEQRIRKTVQVLEDFGGLAKAQQSDNQLFVVGFGCPFSEVVTEHPRLCVVVQALVGELVGRTAKEQCDRSERPKCCFVIK
jgi:predicted ArsR family transcriptional regulator